MKLPYSVLLRFLFPSFPPLTPLILFQKGWLPLLQVLLAHGADPNKQNEKGTSPLYIACSNRNLECITELLSAGADPNLPNNKGDVPLTAAAYRNMCSGVAALLTAGAKIDQGFFIIYLFVVFNLF